MKKERRYFKYLSCSYRLNRTKVYEKSILLIFEEAEALLTNKERAIIAKEKAIEKE